MQYKAIQVVKFPCKNCQDRCAEPNCHTTCQRYLEAQEEQRKLKMQIVIDRQYHDYRNERLEFILNKKGRRKKYGKSKND